jgi:hypothetical protein
MKDGLGIEAGGSGGAIRTGARFVREKQVPPLRLRSGAEGQLEEQDKSNSRFPSGMTERKAKATTSASATARANAGISPLCAARFGRDDNLMQGAGGATARAKEEADSLRE